MKLTPVQISDYTYALPEERIAKYPLPERDQAKLLVYRNGEISHLQFKQLPDLLNDRYTLFFNDTKVIPARITFNKETGAMIEVFVLQPKSSLHSIALGEQQKSSWYCTIGNVKRWPDGRLLQKETGKGILEARLDDRKTGLVEFTWTPPNMTFAEIMQLAGAVPLPPYIKRAAEDSDRDRYQTIYSREQGAVAAPTAGLHFTKRVLDQLESKGIQSDFLTLHVSAGTFLPVKAKDAMDHTMHEEQVLVFRKTVENLLFRKKEAIAVGTTAIRTLESLYWYGVRLMQEKNAPFAIEAFMPYRQNETYTRDEALTAILDHMKSNGITQLTGSTSIFIFPGYTFRICKGLITNFHQPGSTLLLLVAAFIGPAWKRVYEEALANNYRFLSYGDSSLLLPS